MQKNGFLYDAADLCRTLYCLKNVMKLIKKKLLVVFNEMPFNIVK